MDNRLPLHGYEQAARAAHYIRAHGPAPRVAITLGSGLGQILSMVEARVEIPYRRIPHFPQTTVQGHAGALHLGMWRGVPVALLEGRVHGYEGYHPVAVVFPVRALALAGVQTFIFTCAAGGIAAKARPGSFMVFRDHVRLEGASPLAGVHDPRWGERFVDMTAAYDVELRRAARRAAAWQHAACFEGVYACMPGPAYETPAEIRALKTLGSDAVGMSTVPEVMAARQLGRGVLAIAMIANRAAGLAGRPLSHAEVLRAGRAASHRLAALLDGVVAHLAREQAKGKGATDEFR